MLKNLILGIVIVVTVYMLVPWIMTRVLSIGVMRKGNGEQEVAFTFDDGPDPEYTPVLLDLLSRYGVKATFFVLGSKAEKHPELISRMHREGHLIGIHNYHHLSNWLLLPWTVQRSQVERSADIIESITGSRPGFYRPPWGIMNVFDFRLRKQYTIVLWSVMVQDWRSRIGRVRLKSELQKRIQGGSIVLLHDSGETFGADRNAPEHMLAALEEVFIELNAQNYRYVRIDQLTSKRSLVGLAKRLIVKLWMYWERSFVKLMRVRPVDDDNTLLQLRITEYRGKHSIELADGEQIHKGDRIAELHLDNNLLFQLGSASRSSVHLAIQLVRRAELLMPQINRLLQDDPEYKDVKGLYGISIIHRGTKQLGFTVLDLPDGLFSMLTKAYLKLLLYIIHPEGKDRLKVKSNLLVPKVIAISKKELMNRHIASLQKEVQCHAEYP